MSPQSPLEYGIILDKPKASAVDPITNHLDV